MPDERPSRASRTCTESMLPKPPVEVGSSTPKLTEAVLLAEALGRVIAATETVAARFVVVDPIDEQAAGFYAHHGFRRIPGSLRLVQKVSDIAAALS